MLTFWILLSYQASYEAARLTGARAADRRKHWHARASHTPRLRVVTSHDGHRDCWPRRPLTGRLRLRLAGAAALAIGRLRVRLRVTGKFSHGDSVRPAGTIMHATAAAPAGYYDA